MPPNDHTASVDARTLAGFVPISELSDAHRQELCHHAEVRTLAAGEVLSGSPGLAAWLVYILDGAIALSGGPYPAEQIAARTPGARFALAGMESTQRKVTAVRASTILKIDRAKVSTLLIWAQTGASQPSSAKAAQQQADIAALLLDSQLLARIPPSNIDRISGLVERVEVGAGDTVIAQGEAGEHYYLIEDGRCEVLRMQSTGATPLRLAELGKGSTFGEEALLTDTPRNASVRMLTDGSLLRLSREYFLELVSHPLLQVVDHDRAEDLIALGAGWLDVRTQTEFEHDGLSGAINLPLGSLRERLGELPPDQSFVTYCDSGRRAQAAAFLLSQRGVPSCCLSGGISARRPGAREAQSPTKELPQLHAELARTDAALEDAILNVAQAQATQVAESQRLQNSELHDQAQARLRAAKESADTAMATLQQVKSHKLALDQKVREAEAKAASRRRHAEAQCERMRQETQALLEQEKQRLAEQYREASTRLTAIEDARTKAETHFEAERKRLQSEFEAARARIEQEANRIRQTMEVARREAETKAEALRTRHMAQEEQLRRETESVLAHERARLESEVARSMAAQEHARQLLESTEAERIAAEQEAEQLRESLATEKQSRRDQELREREANAQRLRDEHASSAERLNIAMQQRQDAERLRSEHAEQMMNATLGGERQMQLKADLEAFEKELRAADDRVSVARREHDIAQHQVDLAREVAAATPKQEEEVRLRLYEEMEQFISEEEKRSAQELEHAQRYAEQLEQIQREKETRKRESEQATASMFDELKGMLEGSDDEDPFSRYARERLVAEEKARLVHKARMEATKRTQAARQAMQNSDGSVDD